MTFLRPYNKIWRIQIFIDELTSLHCFSEAISIYSSLWALPVLVKSLFFLSLSLFIFWSRQNKSLTTTTTRSSESSNTNYNTEPNSFCLSLSISPFLSFSLILTRISTTRTFLRRSRFLSLTHSLSLPLSLTHSLSHSLSLTHSLCLSLSLPVKISSQVQKPFHGLHWGGCRGWASSSVRGYVVTS